VLRGSCCFISWYTSLSNGSPAAWPDSVPDRGFGTVLPIMAVDMLLRSSVMTSAYHRQCGWYVLLASGTL
jgi:hypothetical protein